MDTNLPTPTRRPRSLSSWLLASLAEVWPNPQAKANARVGAQKGTEEYRHAYAWEQYNLRYRTGTGLGTAFPLLHGLRVLEIGCGHGGVTCWLAACGGAREAIGIDINTENLVAAERLAAEMAEKRGYPLPVRFEIADAERLNYPDGSFDCVFGDNAFEHFEDPEGVLRECYRVLNPGGTVVAPTFPSIKSKYGLHLKNGLRLPWANLFFSEKTIVDAMLRRAARNPDLYKEYPGLLRDNVERVRDLREYRDLNGITYTNFRQMAERVGLKIKAWRVHGTLTGRVLMRLRPSLAYSPLLDILSTGAGAVLQKPR